MSHRFPRLRYFQHNPSGPHSVAAIVDHAIITASLLTRGTVTASGDAGQLLQFVATAYDASGSAVTTAVAAWSVEDRSVASVDSNGLVTMLRSGVTNVFATVDGRTYPTVVSVSVAPGATQDGSFADLQSIVTDQHMPSAWEFPSSIVALDGGGFVSSVPDIRGSTSRLPLTGFAIAGNKPSYDAVNGRISTNGGLNYLQTAFDVGYDLNGTKTLALISTSNPGASDFTACIQGNGDSAPVLGLALDAGGKGIIGAAPNGAVVQVGKGLAPQPGVIGLHIVSQALRIGVGGTLSYPLTGYERPGRVRFVSNLSAVAPAAGACAVTLGGWRNSVGLVGDVATFCAAYVFDVLPTLAIIQALQRRAVVLGATLS